MKRDQNPSIEILRKSKKTPFSSPHARAKKRENPKIERERGGEQRWSSLDVIAFKRPRIELPPRYSWNTCSSDFIRRVTIAFHPLPTTHAILPSVHAYIRVYMRVYANAYFNAEIYTNRERERGEKEKRWIARVYMYINTVGTGIWSWNAFRPSWCAHAARRQTEDGLFWIGGSPPRQRILNRVALPLPSTTPICSGPALLCPSIPLLRRNEAAVATHRCGRRLLRNHPLVIDLLFFFLFFFEMEFRIPEICCKLLSFRD